MLASIRRRFRCSCDQKLANYAVYTLPENVFRLRGRAANSRMITDAKRAGDVDPEGLTLDPAVTGDCRNITGQCLFPYGMHFRCRSR